MSPRIYEAAIDDAGQITLLETVTCSGKARALVVILEGEEPSSNLAVTSAEALGTVTAPGVHPSPELKVDQHQLGKAVSGGEATRTRWYGAGNAS